MLVEDHVKGGIITWETQQTDYPRTRPDLPNHEPRGCARGELLVVSLFGQQGEISAHPLAPAQAVARGADKSPVAAWASIVEDAGKRASYTKVRGHGGFVRAHWDEVNEIIAAANAYTCRKHGPDRVVGFSPIRPCR